MHIICTLFFYRSVVLSPMHRSRHADFGFLVLFYRDRATLWSPEMFFRHFWAWTRRILPFFVSITIKRPFCREDFRSHGRNYRVSWCIGDGLNTMKTQTGPVVSVSRISRILNLWISWIDLKILLKESRSCWKAPTDNCRCVLLLPPCMQQTTFLNDSMCTLSLDVIRKFSRNKNQLLEKRIPASLPVVQWIPACEFST